MSFDFNSISSSTPIDCKGYYTQEREIVKQYIHDNDLEGQYYLAVIQLGAEGESTAYINGKRKDLEYIGCELKAININSKEAGYIQKTYNTVLELGRDTKCAGIMVEIDRSLMKGTNPNAWQGIYNAIIPQIDIDGLNENSKFKSCTAEGTLNLLENYLKVDLRGKQITILGRSKLVGKPIIDMLIEKGATVICCNSHTPSWMTENYIANSEIVISAMGNPNKITTDDFYFTERYIVIDIGTTYLNGKLCGDVNPEVYEDDYFKILYTSVPGGMGLVTRATVLQHFLFGIQYREKQNEVHRNMMEQLKGSKIDLDENGNFILVSKDNNG